MVLEEFTIQRVRETSRCTLILAGRLDLASASTLEEMIVGLCEDGTREVVLHLDALTYFDTTGLRMLLHGRQLCAEHGLDFRLVPVGRGVADASRARAGIQCGGGCAAYVETGVSNRHRSDLLLAWQAVTRGETKGRPSAEVTR